MNYVKSNYSTEDKIMVFSPNSDSEIIQICRDLGFPVFELRVEDIKTWQLDYDPHWSCHGHQEVARQVKHFIERTLKG